MPAAPRGAAIALLLCLVAGPLCAQSLSETDRATLRQAGEQQDAALAEAVVVEAIERNPADAWLIVLEAVDLAPNLRERIIAAVTGAYDVNRRPQPEGEAAEERTQLPTPPPPQAAVVGEPPDNWDGEVSFGGGRTTGNNETTSANAAIELNYGDKPLSSESNLRLNLQNSGGRRTAEVFVADNDIRYDITEITFLSNFIEYRNDRFSGFDYEIIENPGLGRQFIDTPRFKLSAQAGPALHVAKESVTDRRTAELGARASSDLSWMVSPTTTLTNELSFDVTGERRVTQDMIKLDVEIFGRLDGRVSFSYRNNSNPPDGRKSTDTITNFSLVYDF